MLDNLIHANVVIRTFYQLWQLILLVFLSVLFSADAVAAMREVPVKGKLRQTPIQQVVIHATGGPDCNPTRRFQSGTLNSIATYFLHNHKRISIHYIIDRNGDLAQMVPESQIAHHVRSHNANSIGIELINNGDGQDPFSAPQIAALVTLLREIFTRYHLTVNDLKSHSELDQSELNCDGVRIKRKIDPGPAFPWQQLRQALSLNQYNNPQNHEKTIALKMLIPQWLEQEQRTREQLTINLTDQKDVHVALNWKSPSTEQNLFTIKTDKQLRELRLASIQDVMLQLKQREIELRSEIQGFVQLQRNAKMLLRQLQLQINQ